MALNNKRAFSPKWQQMTAQSADCLMTTLFLSFYVIQRPTGAHAIECHFSPLLQKIKNNF